MGQKEADEWLRQQSKIWDENFPGAPFADGKTVIGLLDRLAALEAERDALKDACFTAVMALAHASQRHPEYNDAYDAVSAAIAAKGAQS